MASSKPIPIKSISEVHRMLGLPMPEHPLITILDYAHVYEDPQVGSVVMDFYSVSIKRGVNKMYYGQQTYDFDGGVMALMAPNQVLKALEHSAISERSGWMLLFHPDLLWNTPLAKK